MPIRRLIVLVVVAATLAACGGAPVSPSGSSTPAASAAAPSASTGAPTTVPEPTAAHAARFEGLASGLDNLKQARIRVTNGVPNAPQVDVAINGLPAFNAGHPQENIDSGHFSGWLYVTPGTYTVALIPHGGTLAQALFAPVAVDAAAGHCYTVAAVGEQKNITSLVVDETTLEAGIGTKPTGDILIDINNVSGIAGIDEQLAGSPTTAHIPYGTAQAYGCPIGRPHAITSVTGKPTTILGQGDNTCTPATSMILLDYGPFPGDGSSSQATSELTMLDFLAEFNKYQVATDDGHVLTFKTLLAAIDTAGMRDQFTNSGPYFFFAPTDEAFAALPKPQREALLADPEALRTLLKAHFIPGYYPFGNLFSVSASPQLTNLLGHTFTMTEADNSDIVNGVPVMGMNDTVGNGNRVQFIDKLLPVK